MAAVRALVKGRLAAGRDSRSSRLRGRDIDERRRAPEVSLALGVDGDQQCAIGGKPGEAEQRTFAGKRGHLMSCFYVPEFDGFVAITDRSQPLSVGRKCDRVHAEQMAAQDVNDCAVGHVPEGHGALRGRSGQQVAVGRDGHS